MVTWLYGQMAIWLYGYTGIRLCGYMVYSYLVEYL